MNYLAHLHLSQWTSLSLVGNLMGDFMKGVDITMLPSVVQRGIKNHQAVDKFTDSHVVVKELKKLFTKERKRFASIALDILFDHFLILHWQKFHGEELSSFLEKVYKKLDKERGVMPIYMQEIVSRIIEYDILHSYKTLEGVSAALDRVASRITMKHSFYNAIIEVEEHYKTFEEGFLLFFPDLVAHIDHLAIESNAVLL